MPTIYHIYQMMNGRMGFAPAGVWQSWFSYSKVSMMTSSACHSVETAHFSWSTTEETKRAWRWLCCFRVTATTVTRVSTGCLLRAAALHGAPHTPASTMTTKSAGTSRMIHWNSKWQISPQIPHLHHDLTKMLHIMLLMCTIYSCYMYACLKVQSFIHGA